jgi:hypothetical protein
MLIITAATLTALSPLLVVSAYILSIMGIAFTILRFADWRRARRVYRETISRRLGA